jgi:hypothetical protein
VTAGSDGANVGDGGVWPRAGAGARTAHSAIVRRRHRRMVRLPFVLRRNVIV